jgi:ribose 5-phosphate isomerase B
MKIYLATDHAGLILKERIKKFLKGLGYEVADEGNFVLDPEDDYPDFIRVAAKQVSSDPTARAIVFGLSGQGEAMVANRFPGVRAAVYYGGPREIITLSRLHNDANVLALGVKFLEPDQVEEVVHVWLAQQFSDEDRHRRRIGKIDRPDNALPEF